MIDSFSDSALHALVDRLLLEQGRLDPLELLLAAGLLAYEDYESWKLGQANDLQGLLTVPPPDIAELLERSAAYARGQKLDAAPLEHRGWGASDRLLRIGSHAALVRACSVAFAPSENRMQLDLFHDSSPLVLEDAIRRALAERRIGVAREHVARLMRQDPRNRHLHGFLRLIQAIDGTGASSPRERLSELDAIEPLAHELLGHRARDFLAPLWSALAESLSNGGFEPGSPRLHPSYAWARAERWEAAREAVETEPDWRDEPLLVLAHAEACWRRHKPPEARTDWMWLCWEHPLHAERAFGAPGFPDRRLSDLWNRFGDLDPALETEDFPAWLLLAEPGTVSSVPPDAAPPDERGAAYRILHRLVSGGDGIEPRRELAEIGPNLLRLFLAQRG